MPGCGRGHDVRLAASHGCHVTGLDISQMAIEEAKMLGGSDHAHYVIADFFQLPGSLMNQFDGIIEHTCFCAIRHEERTAYLESVLQALRPQGWLLGVFFIQVSDESEGEPPWSVSSEELDRLFSKDFELIESYTALQTYESRKDCTEELRFMRRKSVRLS